MPTGIGARIPGLGIFLSLKQTAADSNFGPWFDLFPSKSNPQSKNIICRARTELQLSFKGSKSRPAWVVRDKAPKYGT
jgi:hypothetical protein